MVIERSPRRRGFDLRTFGLTAPVLLEQLLMPAVEAAGFRLVRLRLMGGERKTLQVMAERADGTMNVDDCAELSQLLSEVQIGRAHV